MNDTPPNPALLPAGLRDLLPPEAETEAAAVEAVMDAFAAHGYQPICSPAPPPARRKTTFAPALTRSP